jgi:uncharacterized protein (DUF849 family)
MNYDVMLTCAVTGGGDTARKSPHVPVTPEQIANACIAAARAGAAIAHVHVRDPATGQGTRNVAYYQEVLARVADSGIDVILNLTTGMGGDFTAGELDPLIAGPGTDFVGPQARLEHIEALRPPICSLDCGSMNFGEQVFMNTVAHVRTMAKRIQALGVKPELEVFDLGHVRLANELCKEGLVDAPALYQVCLGIPWGAGADARSMQAMVDALPAGAIWSGFGIGRMQMPMVAQAVLLGGNVRVGLEDNLYLDKGKLATNAELVTRAVEIIERLGARVLGPQVVRERLSLRPAIDGSAGAATRPI